MPLGRESLTWGPNVWSAIDQAVTETRQRTQVAAKFLPIWQAANALSAPADVVAGTPLQISEGDTVGITDVGVPFALTQAQVSQEEPLGTAVTLASRAANSLALAEDLLIFQGKDAARDPLFTGGLVHLRKAPADKGLLGAAPDTQDVPQESGGGYGPNTYTAVAEGLAELTGKGQNGPYALVLNFNQYADTYAPLPSTLVTTADRLRGLVTWFYSSGGLPDQKGIIVSVGGDTVDLVLANDAVTEFVQVDADGLSLFRVFERFALRVKDATALVALDFQ
jgi:uncharacterized linocin/CFP29 family protein